MKRSSYIDVLRGLGILLVIFGHAGQRSAELIPQNAWSAAAFSFGQWHMALFMVISGWLAFGRVPLRVGPWIARKARMLMVPYFVWSLAYYWVPDPFIQKFDGFETYARMVIQNPANTFWYFYVLFLCYVGIAVVSKLGTWSVIPLGILIVLSPVDMFGIDLLGWYWWWFGLGYLAARFEEQLVRSRKLSWAVAAAAYSALLYLSPGAPPLWLRVVWGLAGIGVSTAFAALLTRTPAHAPLAHMGRHTFELYPSEFIFFLIPLPLALLRIPAHTVIAVLGGLGLGALLRGNPVTAALFLGDRVSVLVSAPKLALEEGS